MPALFPRLISRLAVVLSVGLLPLSSIAVTLPAGVNAGPSVEGVTEYTLNNGLKVLLAPDNSKPNTTVNMTYLVGARQENYGQTGMAHLLEHMLFRGTPTLRNALGEFSKRGLQANGSTSADRTNYYASFAANTETLDWYIRWQADAMVNSLILREDLDAEMTVVRNEMERGENSPFQILLQKMQATAYQWHNYGQSTIGARTDVENVDIAQLRAFYTLYYQPDNAVLIISGQFDPDTTLTSIAQAFLPIPKPTRVLPPEYTVEPVQDGERQVTLRRHGGSPLIAALFHAPAAGSPDFSALDLGVSILADTPSGRLYHQLVGNKLSTDVFGFAAGMYQPGYAFFGAQLEPGMDQALALKTLDDTLASVVTEPFIQADLDRIRNKWLTSWSQTFANPVSLAGALSESVAEGDWRLFFLQRDRVEAMPLEQVQQATANWLVASNRTNGLYIPTDQPLRAPTPTAISLSDSLKDYKGKAIEAAVAAFDPSPANIDASTTLTELPMPNGHVELALLPKATRGNLVDARMIIQFGDLESLKGQRNTAAAVISLLDHGTHQMSRQDIQDRYDALKADVSYSGDASTLAVGMSTTREHLPELVKLVLHIAREANFPANELAEYQRQVNTSIKNAMAEPNALASRALSRHEQPWARDDIRYIPTFDESLEETAALTPETLKAFHQRFYGAGMVRFSAVGDFDPEAVTASLKTGLQGWAKAPTYQRISHPWYPVTPENFVINTPDKANAFYMMTLPLKRKDTDPDFPALYLANYLLGSSETSRLWNRIREQDGLSYNVRSNLTISPYEDSGMWTIYAILAPENAQKLTSAVHEELERVLKDGFTDAEIQEGATALLNYRKLARTSDDTLATAWINYMQQDRNFAWSQGIDDDLRKLTADQVNQAVKATLDIRQFSTALAADSTKTVPASQSK
ncbi:insulinase family protein [Alcaligenaceae bacterium]|nr:insulinase family protein [Alcaligenaceae bacterium]